MITTQALRSAVALTLCVWFAALLPQASMLRAQSNKDYFNPLITGVPSLNIAPDARGGAMGDVGAASYPDVASQYWNPAKYAFSDSPVGVALHYTPWLRPLVNNINLLYLSGYYKFGSDDNQALSGSLRYFSLGEFIITNDFGDPINSIAPYDMAIDVAYSRKLSETFSASVAFRYIHSDLRTDSESSVGSAFAADIAAYYHKYLFVGRNECLWSWGVNVSNIGSKVSYDYHNTSNFIPTNLRLGTAFTFPMDNFNTMALHVDVNRLLVPSRPVNLTEDPNDPDYLERLTDYKNMSPIAGIFQSFGDTPDGFNGELRKLNLSLGVEYAYNNRFFGRIGYHYQHPMMGNRQYVTFGAGFKLNIFSLDAAYLVSNAQRNPLDQTLRFTLAFDYEGMKSLMK